MQVLVDSECLLVKPEMAATQLAADEAEANASGSSGEVPARLTNRVRPAKPLPENPKARRQPQVALSRLARCGVSTVQSAWTPSVSAATPHALPTKLSSTWRALWARTSKSPWKSTASLPDGASQKLVRDITENCRTLNFEDYGFEEA